MRAEQFEPHLAWSDFVVVRLLRRYAAARTTEANPLPGLVELAKELGEPAQVAIALHSLFQLTEGCLGRPLEAECCCSREMSADERAVLSLLENAPAEAAPAASLAIPHGLPSALTWAVTSVRIVLRCPDYRSVDLPFASCPFGEVRARTPQDPLLFFDAAKRSA